MDSVQAGAAGSVRPADYGVSSMTARLERVLVRRPALTGDWEAAEWRRPDPDLLHAQHEAFCTLLADLGCRVEVAEALEGLVDATYVHDPFVMTPGGAIVLQQAKPVRAGEPRAAERDLSRIGVPVAGRLTGAARADGGDKLWLDERTVALGATYRTNAEGRRQLREQLGAQKIAVEVFDLPHDRGPSSVLHLLSLASPVTDRLYVLFEPLAPVRLLETLRERDIEWIAVSHDEYGRLGTNVLAVAPGVVVVAEGAPEVRRALEGRGCEVHEYAASELSMKGDGGPTCLTAPLLRRAGG